MSAKTAIGVAIKKLHKAHSELIGSHGTPKFGDALATIVEVEESLAALESTPSVLEALEADPKTAVIRWCNNDAHALCLRIEFGSGIVQEHMKAKRLARLYEASLNKHMESRKNAQRTATNLEE